MKELPMTSLQALMSAAERSQGRYEALKAVWEYVKTLPIAESDPKLKELLEKVE